jgi:hypothetical protein
VLTYKISRGKERDVPHIPAAVTFPVFLESERQINFCVTLAIIYTVQVQAPNLIMASDKRWLCLILTLAHFVDFGAVNNPEMLKCVVRSV